jgi:amino acid transporter
MTLPLDGPTPTADKGLKAGALHSVMNVVLGVASAAPAYSLAATLGFIALAVGFQSPAIMVLSFVPLFCTGVAMYYLNRADPDCGNTFSWVTKAMGPQLGFFGGWIILAANVLVVSSDAHITGQYTFLLLGWQSAAGSQVAVTALGALWVVFLCGITLLGVELSARVQYLRMIGEFGILALFAVVALAKIFIVHPAGSVSPSLSWLNPLAFTSTSAMAGGVTLAVFMCNEESVDRHEGPGRSVIVTTLLLVVAYVVVAIAAQGFVGARALAGNPTDVLNYVGAQVLPAPFDKLLVLAVLSACAGVIVTTVMPLGRISLSMATKGALPKAFCHVHPRFRVPWTGSIVFAGLALVWFVVLSAVSQNVLGDSIAATGLMVAVYYTLGGIACPIFYRRRLLRSASNLLLMGVVPLLGSVGLAFIVFKEGQYLWNPADSFTAQSWLGVGPPFVISVGVMALGLVVMVVRWIVAPTFFRQRPITVDQWLASPDATAAAVLETEAASTAGSPS